MARHTGERVERESMSASVSMVRERWSGLRGHHGVTTAHEIERAQRLRRDPDEEVRVIEEFQRGSESAERVLIHAHRNVCRMIAGHYAKGASLDFEDFFQEARLAMLEGCMRFDVSKMKGKLPSTFWGQNVRFACKRYRVEKTNGVRIPSYMYDEAKTSSRGRSRLHLMSRQTFCFSEMPDRYCAWDERRSFEDGIVSDDPDVDEVLGDDELERLLGPVARALLEGMAERELEILWRRARGETLLEIGDDKGLSQERIRQIEEIAISRARERAKRRGADPEKFRSFIPWFLALARGIIPGWVTASSGSRTPQGTWR